MESSQVIEHLIRISSDLGSLNSKLDALAAATKSHVDSDNKLHDEIEDRIQKLEYTQNKMKWVTVGIVTALSAVYNLISDFLTK